MKIESIPRVTDIRCVINYPQNILTNVFRIIFGKIFINLTLNQSHRCVWTLDVRVRHIPHRRVLDENRAHRPIANDSGDEYDGENYRHQICLNSRRVRQVIQFGRVSDVIHNCFFCNFHGISSLLLLFPLIFLRWRGCIITSHGHIQLAFQHTALLLNIFLPSYITSSSSAVPFGRTFSFAVPDATESFSASLNGLYIIIFLIIIARTANTRLF